MRRGSILCKHNQTLTCFHFRTLAEALFVVYQYWTIILQNDSVSLVAKDVGENEEVELLSFLFTGHLQAPSLKTVHSLQCIVI